MTGGEVFFLLLFFLIPKTISGVESSVAHRTDQNINFDIEYDFVCIHFLGEENRTVLVFFFMLFKIVKKV